MVLKTIYIFFLIIAIGYYPFVPLRLDETLYLFFVLISVFSVLLFFSRREPEIALKGQYLRHTTLALIGMLIVFFQVPIDYLMGNVSSNNLFLFIDQQIILKSIVISSIGVLCFLIGALSYKKKVPKKVPKMVTDKSIRIDFLLLFSAIALSVYFFTVNPLYLLGGNYGKVEIGSTAMYAVTFFNFFTFAAFIQKCRNLVVVNQIPGNFASYLKKLGWPLLTLTFTFLVSVVISGDRGPLIIYSILIISGYFFLTKIKLPFILICGLVILAASIVTILGLARAGGKKHLTFAEKIEESMKGDAIYNRYDYNSFSPVTQELSISYNALNTVVDHVPEERDFFYGRFQFQRLGIIVPFFSKLYPLIYSDTSPKYQTSATYITWLQQGDFPRYGSGTSSLADLYLDFGLIGVIVGMYLFGYYMRFGEIAMYTQKVPHLFSQVFFMVFLSYIIYISRSSILSNLLTAVWIYVILIFNRVFLTRLIRS